MMRQHQCHDVRRLLEACHDGELSTDEQVAVQSHLYECVACTLEVAALEELSESLRHTASSLCAPNDALGLSQTVVDRLGVESQFSRTARFHRLFQDMHLVWAALGATVATIICMIASAGVLHAASQEQPDSLAALIAQLANPGSNANPLMLDTEMMMPRFRMESLAETSREDTDLALALVVTREGRIQQIEVLAAEQASALRVNPAVVTAMLNDAARTRFEPAQARMAVCKFDGDECGGPVAVNVVWLMTTTTVKGRRDAEVVLIRQRWRATEPVMGPLPEPPTPDAAIPAAVKPLPGISNMA